MSASLRSRRVGSLVRPRCCSVTRTRTRPSSSSRLREWTPAVSWRAGVVLNKTRRFIAAIDGDRQLAYTARQYALDVVLPQSEPIIVPGGKIANVQNGGGGEGANLSYLPLREEPISNSALIENLDGT